MTSRLYLDSAGVLRRRPAGIRVETPKVYYMRRLRDRGEVVWHLAFGHWPKGFVESEDGTYRPSTLKIVTIPERFRGKMRKL